MNEFLNRRRKRRRRTVGKVFYAENIISTPILTVFPPFRKTLNGVLDVQQHQTQRVEISPKNR